jgi:hypothetical protein
MNITELKALGSLTVTTVSTVVVASGELIQVVGDIIHIGANLAARPRRASDTMQRIYDAQFKAVEEYQFELAEKLGACIPFMEATLNGEPVSDAGKLLLKELQDLLKA